MKRQDPPFGGPDQAARQSNQTNLTPNVLSQDDGLGIVNAWRIGVDSLAPAWPTITRLVHSLQTILASGSARERTLALEAIHDIAMRRGLSIPHVGELIRNLRGEG
jgi:hypothetical protein